METTVLEPIVGQFHFLSRVESHREFLEAADLKRVRLEAQLSEKDAAIADELQETLLAPRPISLRVDSPGGELPAQPR